MLTATPIRTIDGGIDKRKEPKGDVAWTAFVLHDLLCLLMDSVQHQRTSEHHVAKNLSPPEHNCRPSSPRRRRINYGENGEYSHVNGNHTPYEQREKRRPADGALGQSRVAQSELGRFQVLLPFSSLKRSTTILFPCVASARHAYKHPDLFMAVEVFLHVVCTVRHLQVYAESPHAQIEVSESCLAGQHCRTEADCKNTPTSAFALSMPKFCMYIPRCC